MGTDLKDILKIKKPLYGKYLKGLFIAPGMGAYQ